MTGCTYDSVQIARFGSVPCEPCTSTYNTVWFLQEGSCRLSHPPTHRLQTAHNERCLLETTLLLHGWVLYFPSFFTSFLLFLWIATPSTNCTIDTPPPPTNHPSLTIFKLDHPSYPTCRKSQTNETPHRIAIVISISSYQETFVIQHQFLILPEAIDIKSTLSYL